MLIADDQIPIRRTVKESLEAGGFTVCAEVGTAQEALEAALEMQPDICLLDIRMPGNGIHAAGTISRKIPASAVVMLTASSADSDLFDAIKAGARGYLLKGLDARTLPRELQRVLDGEAVLPGLLAARVLEEFRSRSEGRRLMTANRGRVELTDREWSVLELLAENLKTKEIASRLFISPVTVRSHVAKILDKLQVASRQEAVKLLKE